MKEVIPQQDAIEVFANDYGSISIKQQSFDGDNSIIAIHSIHIPALVKALRQCAKEISAREN